MAGKAVDLFLRGVYLVAVVLIMLGAVAMGGLFGCAPDPCRMHVVTESSFASQVPLKDGGMRVMSGKTTITSCEVPEEAAPSPPTSETPGTAA